MEVFNWILAAFAAITGSTTFITLFMFRKQQKRQKTAEAFSEEVRALQSTVDSLQKQVDWQEKRLEKMQETINSKDVYIGALSNDKHTLEIKHAKNKTAINQAYSCKFCDDKAECPVLMQRAVNEETYLKQVEKKIK